MSPGGTTTHVPVGYLPNGETQHNDIIHCETKESAILLPVNFRQEAKLETLRIVSRAMGQFNFMVD